MQPSDNPVRTKFAEHAFHALGRIVGNYRADARLVPHEGEVGSRRRGILQGGTMPSTLGAVTARRRTPRRRARA